MPANRGSGPEPGTMFCKWFSSHDLRSSPRPPSASVTTGFWGPWGSGLLPGEGLEETLGAPWQRSQTWWVLLLSLALYCHPMGSYF